MTYFDTDYLIHYLVNQDKELHRLATRKIKNLIAKSQFYISPLNLQEIGFVLAKLNTESFSIIEKLNELESHSIVNYTSEHFRRAKELAFKVGFQNINDCIHTAIAESYCSEIYTCNKIDFERIKPLTHLKVIIF